MVRSRFRNTIYCVAASLLLISVAACKTTSSSDFCLVAKPYRHRAGEVYTDENKKQIIAYNEYGRSRCGWKSNADAG